MSYLDMAKAWKATQPTSKEKESISGYELNEINEKTNADVIDFAVEAEKVKAHLQRHGIAKIRSATLDEDVFFAVDDKAAARAPKKAVVYTLGELRELARGPLTQDDLKQVHAAKKVFNGRVVQNSKNPF